MVFNVTVNNISIISWRSVLLVEETRGPGENHCTLINNVSLSMLDILKVHASVRVQVFNATFNINGFKKARD